MITAGIAFKIAFLLVFFQAKHFLADFPLQTQFMLGKFKAGWGWILPLTCHAGVHAAFTFLIALVFGSHYAMGLALFDFACHFTMDRIKASPNLLGKYKPLSAKDYQHYLSNIKDFEGSGNTELELAAKSFKKQIQDNKYFWWALGLDQMVHHLTHYVIIWCLLV